MILTLVMIVAIFDFSGNAMSVDRAKMVMVGVTMMVISIWNR